MAKKKVKKKKKDDDLEIDDDLSDLEETLSEEEEEEDVEEVEEDEDTEEEEEDEDEVEEEEEDEDEIEDELEDEDEEEDEKEEEEDEDEEEEKSSKRKKSGSKKKGKKKEEEDDDEEAKARMVKISEIVVPKKKVRDADEDEIKEMANSIKQNGMLCPISITSENILVDGLRRLEAHKKLKKKEIYCDIAEIDKNDVYFYSGVGNYVRNQMTPQEEGKYISTLLKDKKKFPDQKTLAKKLGVSQSRVSRSLKSIGEAKEYGKSKEKRKEKAKKKKEKKEKKKSVTMSSDSLPDNVKVKLSKEGVNVSFDLVFKNAAHAKKFKIDSELNKLIKKIDVPQLKEEISILRKELL